MFKLYLIHQLPLIEDVRNLIKYLWILKEHWELIRHLKFLYHQSSPINYHGIKIRNPSTISGVHDTLSMDVFYTQNEFRYYMENDKRKTSILTPSDVIYLLLIVNTNKLNWIYTTTFILN